MARLALNLVDEQDIESKNVPLWLSNGQLTRMFPEHNIDREQIRTRVPIRLINTPGIDTQLKEIIARCLADDPEDMLNFRNLVILCEDGVNFWSPPQINNMPSVRSEELRPHGDPRFMRDFVYNADTQAEHSILGEQNRFGEWV